MASAHPPRPRTATCSFTCLRHGILPPSPPSSSPRPSSCCSCRALRGPHPGARTEYTPGGAGRSQVELIFCGFVPAKWLQRAHFAGLPLQSRG
jgi:hypothetical protein